MPTFRPQASLKPLTVAATALLLLAAAGCVTATKHDQALKEIDRLRKENLELRRDLAERQVRLQELREQEGLASPATTAAGPVAPATGKPSGEGSPAGSSPATAAGTPVAAAGQAPLPAIQEEEVREPQPEPGAEGERGERTLWVARHYRDAGKISQAIEAYSKFIQSYPFSPLLPDAFMERADARLKSGDRQGASDDFQTVVEAFPSSPLAARARREVDRLGGS
jgi:TolA-binding protein